MEEPSADSAQQSPTTPPALGSISFRGNVQLDDDEIDQLLLKAKYVPPCRNQELGRIGVPQKGRDLRLSTGKRMRGGVTAAVRVSASMSGKPQEADRRLPEVVTPRSQASPRTGEGVGRPRGGQTAGKVLPNGMPQRLPKAQLAGRVGHARRDPGEVLQTGRAPGVAASLAAHVAEEVFGDVAWRMIDLLDPNRPGPSPGPVPPPAPAAHPPADPSPRPASHPSSPRIPPAASAAAPAGPGAAPPPSAAAPQAAAAPPPPHSSGAARLASPAASQGRALEPQPPPASAGEGAGRARTGRSAGSGRPLTGAVRAASAWREEVDGVRTATARAALVPRGERGEVPPERTPAFQDELAPGPNTIFAHPALLAALPGPAPPPRRPSTAPSRPVASPAGGLVSHLAEEEPPPAAASPRPPTRTASGPGRPMSRAVVLTPRERPPPRAEGSVWYRGLRASGGAGEEGAAAGVMGPVAATTVQEEGGERCFVFVYGLEAGAGRMAAALGVGEGEAGALGRTFALLFDWRLAFLKRGASEAAGRFPAPVLAPGRSVEGALYSLDRWQLELLDRSQGCPEHFERGWVNVWWDPAGSPVLREVATAAIYLPRAKWLAPTEGPANALYVRTMRREAADLLSPAFLAATFPLAPAADPARHA